MELQSVEFHLPSFLEGVVEICRIKAEQKQLTFIYKTEGRLPTGIEADEKRLRQVLINLLGNAIKFTANGKVTFFVKAEQHTEVSSGQPIRHRIHFQVEDTGVGITPSHLTKIFLPFEQDSHAAKQAEGTGLGLAISQSIANLMGSSIQVESQPNEGSTFWFEVDLPESTTWTQSSLTPQQGIIANYEGDRRKILVIDDRWENRSVLTNLLQPIGFQIEEASNGREGLEKASTFQPDAIVVDLVMPVMDGYEMLRQLRRLPEFQNTVVLVASASAFEADQTQSFQAGANAFLPKPIQADALLAALRMHLGLEWIYDGNSTQTQHSGLMSEQQLGLLAPSQSDLLVLHDFSRKGLVNSILKELERIEQQDANLVPFVQALRQHTKSFQLKKIREFIEQYLDRAES
jgi:CheY-like chemotaxis protein